MNSIQTNVSLAPILLTPHTCLQKDNSSEAEVGDIAKQQFQKIDHVKSQSACIPQDAVKLFGASESLRLELAVASACTLIEEMRQNLQITNALHLEKVIQREKKQLAEKLGMDVEENIDDIFKEVLKGSKEQDVKRAKERIEDAMDGLKSVSLLDQLDFLTDYPEVASLLQKTLIERQHHRIKETCDGLNELQKQFQDAVSSTLSCSFHSQILEFISQKKDELFVSVKLYKSKDYFRNQERATPVKALPIEETRAYVISVENLINAIEKELEKKISVRRITPLLKGYRILDKEILSVVPLLIQESNYLGAHLLDAAQKRNKEKVVKLESSLKSSWQMKAYSDVLEAAIQDFEKTTLEVHTISKEGKAIDQLNRLDRLKSSYTKDLQDLLKVAAREKINEFILKLDHRLSLIATARLAFEQQNVNNVEALEAIVEKIRLKKVKAEELKVSFTARPYFWQMNREAVEVDDLTVRQFEEYVNAVEEIIGQGIKELNEDALNAGFSWD